MSEQFSRVLDNMSSAEVCKPEMLTAAIYGSVPAAYGVQHNMYMPNEMFQVFDASVRGDFIIGNVTIKPDGLTVDGQTVTDAGEIYAALTSALAGHAPRQPGISEAVRTLTDYCYDASHAAGWWVNPLTGIDSRDNPMCFSQKLMLIVSEVAEAMEGDRKSLMDDKLPHRPMREVELADALIRICDLAGAYGMDLGGAVEEKMAFNKVRPDHQIAARAVDGGKAY